MDKKVQLPVKFEMSDEILNNNFHKVKIYVCHNGENYNGSNFSDLAIAKASKTLQNIPILAYIERDEEGNALGFGGHEIEYKLEEKNGEYYFREHYLEIPIGVIPSQNEYTIESMNGKNYVVCSGYIWKCYSNEAYDLLLDNNEQNVSMEISCNDVKYLDNGIYDILDYEYLGVTVIGCEPAMQNAKVQMSFSNNNNNNKEYEEKVKELDELLANFSLVKGGDDVEEKNIVGEFEEEVVIEESQVQEFAEEEKEDDVCPECGKNPCECEEDDKEECQKEDEEESQEEEEKEEKIYSQSEMDEAIANAKAEFTQAMEELEVLRQFKADYDKALEVQELNEEMDNLVSQFSCDDELVKELREKVLNKEITMDTFELQLWRNNKKVAKKEFSKETQSNKLPVMDNEKEISEVDKLFASYGIYKK